MPQSLKSAEMEARHKPGRRNRRSPSVTKAPELDVISPDRVMAQNAFYRRRFPADVTLAGQPAKVAAAWPASRPVDQPSCGLLFKIGEHSAELCVPPKLLEQLLIAVEKTARLETLPPRYAALLLEAALADELDWLEARLQAPMELTAVEAQAPSMTEPQFGFVLSIGGQEFGCALRSDDNALPTRLAALLDESGLGELPPPVELPLSVRLWRDVLAISLGEARRLQTGDVVLLDEQAAAMLVIGDGLIAPVAVVASGSQLLAAPVIIAGSKWEWTMGENLAGAGQAIDDATLDDLPVALAFEVGRKTMPLGEIRQLTAGAIVQLDTTGHAVDILANGKRVGQGEMVKIGESLGVQVTRMFDNA